LAYLALASFVNSHIPDDLRGDLAKGIESLGHRRQELAQAARKRWGDEDPFPGKW